jgi:hypothetical protein
MQGRAHTTQAAEGEAVHNPKAESPSSRCVGACTRMSCFVLERELLFACTPFTVIATTPFSQGSANSEDAKVAGALNSINNHNPRLDNYNPFVPRV